MSRKSGPRPRRRCDLLGARLEPVEAGLERLLDDGGNDDVLVASGELEPSIVPAEHAPLEQVPKRLFEEERVSAGPLGEDQGDSLRERCACRPRCELDRGALRQRRQLDLDEAVAVAAACPLGEVPASVLVLCPVGEDEGNGLLLGGRKKLVQQGKGRLVSPLQVLEDEAERTLACECGREPADGVERLLLHALAADFV